MKKVLILIVILGCIAVLGFFPPVKKYVKVKWNHGIPVKRVQVKLFPNNPRFLDSLANSLRKTEEFGAAAYTYQLVQKIIQEGSEVKEDQKVMDANRQIEEIENLYKRALGADSQYAKAFYDLGSFYNEIGLIEKSIENLIKANEIDPQLKDVYFELAYTYFLLGQKTKSVDAYLSVLEKFPSDEDVALSVVLISLEILSDKGEDPAFVNVFQAGLTKLVSIINQSEPKASSFSKLGLIYTQIGEYDRAISAYNRALDLDSNNAEVLFNLANIYKEVGNTAQAIENYRKVIQVEPKMVKSYFNLGNIYWRQGKSDLAREIYEKAQKIDPENAKVYYHLGIIEELTGNNQKALDLYGKSVKIDPKNPKVWLNMGNIYVKIGQNDKAQKVYLESVDKDANFMLGWMKLFALSFENQEYEKAATFLKEATLLGYEAPPEALEVLKPYM